MEIGDYIMRGVQGGAAALARGVMEGQRLKITRDLAGQENQLRRDLSTAEQGLAKRKLDIEQGRADAYKNYMDFQTFMGTFDRGWDDLPGWMQARLAQSPTTPSALPPGGPPPQQAPIPGKLKQMGVDASTLSTLPRPHAAERFGY